MLQIELKENLVFLFSSQGTGSATALHPLLSLKIKGSCTARSVNGQLYLVYSEELKSNMLLTIAKKPDLKKNAGFKDTFNT